jgi:hypothetical protein
MKSGLRVAIAREESGKGSQIEKGTISRAFFIAEPHKSVTHTGRRKLHPARAPIFYYSFGLDKSRNEFRNVEKFPGRGALFGAKACRTYNLRPTK